MCNATCFAKSVRKNKFAFWRGEAFWREVIEEISENGFRSPDEISENGFRSPDEISISFFFGIPFMSGHNITTKSPKTDRHARYRAERVESSAGASFFTCLMHSLFCY
jgi:hypothetical protein